MTIDIYKGTPKEADKIDVKFDSSANKSLVHQEGKAKTE